MKRGLITATHRALRSITLLMINAPHQTQISPEATLDEFAPVFRVVTEHVYTCADLQ